MVTAINHVYFNVPNGLRTLLAEPCLVEIAHDMVQHTQAAGVINLQN